MKNFLFLPLLLVLIACSNSGDPQEETYEIIQNINLKELLGADFETNRHMFGNQIETSQLNQDENLQIDYIFENDLIVTINENIVEIKINFQQNKHSPFHFNEINGTSTREDVVTTFGEPRSRLQNDEKDRTWYLYNLYDNKSITFRFDENDIVIHVFAVVFD